MCSSISVEVQLDPIIEMYKIRILNRNHTLEDSSVDHHRKIGKNRDLRGKEIHIQFDKGAFDEDNLARAVVRSVCDFYCKSKQFLLELDNVGVLPDKVVVIPNNNSSGFQDIFLARNKASDNTYHMDHTKRNHQKVCTAGNSGRRLVHTVLSKNRSNLRTSHKYGLLYTECWVWAHKNHTV